MAGLDFGVLAVFIWLVDERGLSKWVKPFLITGMNAITVYLASEFLAEFLDAYGLHETLYNRFFAPFASPMNASLLWALSFVVPHVFAGVVPLSAALVPADLTYALGVFHRGYRASWRPAGFIG